VFVVGGGYCSCSEDGDLGVRRTEVMKCNGGNRSCNFGRMDHSKYFIIDTEKSVWICFVENPSCFRDEFER
jgi:hypothetical protein